MRKTAGSASEAAIAPATSVSAAPWRLYAANALAVSETGWDRVCAHLESLGLNGLLLALPDDTPTDIILTQSDDFIKLCGTARDRGIGLWLDLRVDITAAGSAYATDHDEWFAQPLATRKADPRVPPAQRQLRALSGDSALRGAALAWWRGQLAQWAEAGLSGVRALSPGNLAAQEWRALLAELPLQALYWAPGEAAAMVRAATDVGFSAAFNSLAWWPPGQAWLAEEDQRLAAIGPRLASLAPLFQPAPGPSAAALAQRLHIAAQLNEGFLLPLGAEFGGPALEPEAGGPADLAQRTALALHDLTPAVRAAAGVARDRSLARAAWQTLGAPSGAASLFWRAQGSAAELLLANNDAERTARLAPENFLAQASAGRLGFSTPDGLPLQPGSPVLLPGGATLRFLGHAAPAIHALPSPAPSMAAPRVAIEAVSPSVESPGEAGGRFAAKCVVGEAVPVQADLICDGHGKLAAVVQWRATDTAPWQEVPMALLTNDRWQASFPVERMGRHVFRVVAWYDTFATFRDGLAKKVAARQDVALEAEEGQQLVSAAAGHARSLAPLASKLAAAALAERIALLLDEGTAAAMRQADPREGASITPDFPLEADRLAARFAAWYEVFPRSQSGSTERHGTFRDVIGQLPHIQAMGFDTLYFPPIHPIGQRNRKGRNNSLQPAPDDPGSPYAIGSAEGGHEALHPELGSFEDFQALRVAAEAHGLELAIDFAIQCSPDHPWLREHPEWFDWRPDGSLRYAENPPKKYEDIVNVDFYTPEARPGLWNALRDVVLFWAQQGVRCFRVDNPHTKPLPFWEWMIAEVRAQYPDALFLAEAFTRPKMMYRLGKAGFSQSYTYFTWRNEKWEIERYLRELTERAEDGQCVADFYRPHFFVNTPDINPIFLQHSGRAGFLIRAALAATLSGLWGVYQGFELCEAAAVPGKEEYADSDKYQIRVWPQRRAGDIVEEVTQLNAIRRANPALHNHCGLAFHVAENPQILWFRKATADRANVVMVAISLDPFAPQEARVELPLWEWGLPDHAALAAEDLIHGSAFTWRGKYQNLRLTPQQPYGIWRVGPMEMAR